MSRAASLHIANSLQLVSATPDAYLWQNPNGGLWSLPANWWDTTAGLAAGTTPAGANAVTITGGNSENDFTTVTGSGAAATLSINNDVLLWGSIAVNGGAVLSAGAEFDLDGDASLSAASLTLGTGAGMVTGGGSTVWVSGAALLAGSVLTVVGGSTEQFGTLIGNAVNSGFAILGNVIAVDDVSSLEIGSAGGAALGAITIDNGWSPAVSGTLYGNVVDSGTLAVQANGTLNIDPGDPYGTAHSISGSGTLLISEDSLLTLGVADSAAIRFGGPVGTLDLLAVPTGTISGFTGGDIIELAGGTSVLATGLSYTQTSGSVATLTLTKGGSAAGTLTLAGNYAGDLFHLGFDLDGDGIITVQTPGLAPVQPSLIMGTAGTDALFATANNQTLTGLGGGDTMSAGSFTGIDFKDTSADLRGSAITSFGTSDVIDLTDVAPGGATVTYTGGGQSGGAQNGGTLTVTDGTHSATIAVSFGAAPVPGFFTTGTDGSGGTVVRYTPTNSDAETFAASPGGAYGTAANWLDTTTGTVAAATPSYGNMVTLAGGASYTDITGSGYAASVTATGRVLLWGTLVAGSMVAGVTGNLNQTGSLVLDGAADLGLAGTASVGGLLEIGGGSTLTAGGLSFTGNGASLLAIDGSSGQIAGVLPSGLGQYDTSSILVDANSRIEFGSAGSSALGALTIDAGVTANLAGSIEGNVVVNGTLSAAGSLSVASLGSAAPSVTGAGTLLLTYGDTLGLGGADSAAILFSQTAPASYSSTTETLALGTTMPTGTISGFTKGDVITVGLIVTNVSWNGSRLTLLNSGVTVGSLQLSGTYAANQFQVQLAANGLSSIITYAATPSTVGGNPIAANSDQYSWSAGNGGTWSNASDWTDTTAGTTPVAAAGAYNAVTISDNPGAWTTQIIYGPAAAASLNIASAASTILIGTFNISGLFQVAQYGTSSGDVALTSGSNLVAGSLNVTSLLRLAGASLLTIVGTSTPAFISGELAVGSGSAVRINGGTATITGTVAVDAGSSVEFGTAGTAASGTMTIDNGQTVTLQGVANIGANVVVNGSLQVFAGTIGGFGGATGSITGTGTIYLGALGASGYLTLNATDNDPISFVPYSVNGVEDAFERLELRSPLRVGVIAGFVAGDSIVIDSNVTGASFVQTTVSQGTLTLTNGTSVVGTLTLSGNFAGSVFQVDVAATTGDATISLQPAASAAASGAASTAAHSYNWTGPSGGSWATASNWQDTTAGATATTVPGSTTIVKINGTSVNGQYTVVGGNGSTADLATTGNVLLTGQIVDSGWFHILTGSGGPGLLTLESGAKLTGMAGAQLFGNMEVGGGSSLVLTGSAAFANASLLVLGGSSVQVGGMIGNGNGNIISVDSSSTIKIGTTGTTAPGTITLGPAALPALTGSVYGSVVNNGWIYVSGGGSLFIDMNAQAESDPYASNPTISGSGTLWLLEGSRLGLGVADSAAIQFFGPNATLELVALPTATIAGFTTGDQIQIDRTVTGLSYHQVSANAATLTLTNGASTVGVLNLAGSFNSGNSSFHLDASPNSNTAVITLQSLLPPAQPSLIQGWGGVDFLVATANNQTISGGGGADTMSGGGFTGIDFSDLTSRLNGVTIQNFAPSDMFDFTDMHSASAVATYTGGTLSVTDGTHSAALTVGFASTPASGSFHVASDGASGTMVTWS